MNVSGPRGGSVPRPSRESAAAAAAAKDGEAVAIGGRSATPVADGFERVQIGRLSGLLGGASPTPPTGPAPAGSEGAELPLQVDGAGDPEALEVYFNPKEMTIDKKVPWNASKADEQGPMPGFAVDTGGQAGPSATGADSAGASLELRPAGDRAGARRVDPGDGQG